MRNLMDGIAAVMFLATFTVASPVVAAEKPDILVAYVGGVLIDTQTGTAKQGLTIITRGDRIEEIRPSTASAVGHVTRIVDIKGKFVIPGLVNTHVHTATEAVPALATAYLRRELFSGVTTVRDMAGDVRLLSELKREAEFNEIPSPDIFYVALLAGPEFFVDPRTHSAARGRIAGQVPWMQAITPQTNLPIAIAEARGTGATAVKIYADLSGALVAQITAEAHRQSLLVWTHAAVFPALPSDAANSGVDVMSHACLLGYELSDTAVQTYGYSTPVDENKALKPNQKMTELLQVMKQKGIILDATLYPYEAHQVHSCTPELSAYLARQAYRAGVLLSVGTDDDPIWDDPDSAIDTELALLVDKVGMTPAEALFAATVIGARAAGQQSEVGLLEKGKLANMVVLNSNPLDNIANVRSVFLVVKRGIQYPRSAYRPVSSTQMRAYSE